MPMLISMCSIFQKIYANLNNLQALSLYIQLMRHEEHGHRREGRNVYLENSWYSRQLKGFGERDPDELRFNREEKVESIAKNYLKADMVSLTISFFRV